MQTSIIISGFGGQGVLFTGQLLAYTALDNDLHVTWFPSYGPEMRGGTAHCTVIISDDEIGSPVIRNPDAAIVMNLPSLDKYEPLMLPKGVLVINTSLVDRSVARQDIDSVMVPASEIADELGNRRLANIIMLGALLQRLPFLSIEMLEKGIDAHIPERHRDMLDANLKALHRGFSEAS